MEKNALKLALMTGGLLVGASATGSAEVIYTDLPTPETGSDVYFNLTNRDTTPLDDQFHIYNTNSSKPEVHAENTGTGTATTPGTYGDYAVSFQRGDTIGSSSTFSGTAKMTTGFPQDGTKEYLGLEITPMGAGAPDFGYAQISLDGTDATLYNFAYETDGGPITAGAVPEPSNSVLALLLTGAAAIVVARRRRLEAARQSS